MLFIYGIVFWRTFGNTTLLLFVFMLQPMAHFNLKLHLVLCMPTFSQPDCTAQIQMQFQTNSLVMYKSVWSQYNLTGFYQGWSSKFVSHTFHWYKDWNSFSWTSIQQLNGITVWLDQTWVLEHISNLQSCLIFQIQVVMI